MRDIIQLKDGKEIGRFKSIAEASKMLKINHTNLSFVLNGYRDSTSGFQFIYDDLATTKAKPHQHLCIKCRRKYDCNSDDPDCVNTKMGMCDKCFKAVVDGPVTLPKDSKNLVDYMKKCESRGIK